MKNIKELELRKSQLKDSINSGLNNPFAQVASFISMLSNAQQRKKTFNVIDRKQEQRNELLDEGVKALLTIVASVAVSKFKLGTIPKMLLTSGVAMVTPYVVDKIQKRFK